MSAESVPTVRTLTRHRADQPSQGLEPSPRALIPAAVWVVLAAGFVLLGGGNLDLGEVESRIGLAAGERLGPFGQVYGGWEPALWPGQIAPSLVWAWGEGGMPTSASVRWPAAIAGLVVGLVLARRMQATLGVRAGVLMGFCWFGSVALIDRSGGAGIDLITGMATVTALDRILGRGSDWVAGFWAALALLAGGWPPLVLIALATIAIGRPGVGLSKGLLIPPMLALAAWSGWALSVAPFAAWGKALTLPLSEAPAWGLAIGVVLLGLPWSPLAALALSRSMRAGWPPEGRGYVVGWLQVAGACLLAGTLIPGFGTAARVPALAGLAVAAAACADRGWTGASRRGLLAISATTVALWAILVGIAGIFLASAVPYYRGVSIALICLGMLAVLVAIVAVARSDSRRAVVAIAMVAVCLKLAHWGYYVPEWNYRQSQGPWGRAIGQWVLPRWPIYTTHAWPTELAFAIGRPVRQLRDPGHLAYAAGKYAKFVLLLDSEFEHWPAQAPPLVKVATFEDEHGQPRILARTAGTFSWRTVREQAEE